MINFSEKFQQLEQEIAHEQRRVPVESCLIVFYGITSENHYRISFISSVRPIEFESTKEIKVIQGKESQNVFWTCFDLLHNEIKDVFFLFCDSLIDSIENLTDEYDALSALKERYYAWKLLLKKNSKMSYETYQGLFGELYFLSEYLAKKVGLKDAIDSWVGPGGYSKDFSISDTWCEIKTIGPNSTIIKINSLTQLDSNVKGHLVTVVVEKMSDQYSAEGSSVPDLINSILDSLDDYKVKEDFINKIIKYGYIIEDTGIKNYKFEVKFVTFYSINDDFPKLTKNNINTSAITHVTYDILISALDKFKEE